MGIGFLKVGSELGDVFIPNIIGAFGSAPKHMCGIFRVTTPRACIIVLVFPFGKDLAHVTIGGSMFDNSTPAARLQHLHAGDMAVAVDCQSGIK